MSWSRPALAASAAAAAAWLLAAAAPRDFAVGTFGDDAQYAVLAKSLREARGYRSLNVPGAPAETKYPPLFPAVLASLWSPQRSDAANLERTRALNLVLLGPLAAALALVGSLSLGLGAAESAALAVAGVAAPSFAALWAVPLSEPLSLLLTAVGLLLAARRRPLAATLTLVAAVYARTLALPFLVGVVAAEAVRERRRGAPVALVAVLALAPWGAWSWVQRAAVPDELLGYYGSYGRWLMASLAADPVTALFRVPERNALVVLRNLGEAPAWGSWLPPAIAMIAGAALVWRLWATRRAAPPLALGLALYGVAVLLWPFPGDRFVAAVWPLVLLAAAAGLGLRFSRVVALLALALAAAGFARGEAFRLHRQRAAAWGEMRAALAQRLPSGAVVASGDPALYYLTLAVASVPNGRMLSYRWYRLGHWGTAWGTGEDLWAILRGYGVTHVAVERGRIEGRYAVGSLQRQCPAALSEVWNPRDGALLLAADASARCAPVHVEH